MTFMPKYYHKEEKLLRNASPDCVFSVGYVLISCAGGFYFLLLKQIQDLLSQHFMKINIIVANICMHYPRSFEYVKLFNPDKTLIHCHHTFTERHLVQRG